MSGSPTPAISDLCLAGEAAFRNNEYEAAVEWYALACASTIPTGEYGPVPAGLVEYRFERYAELRQIVPWRSVQRLTAADPGHILAVQRCLPREMPKSTRDAVDLWPRAKVYYADGFIAPGGERHYDGQAKTFFDILRWAAHDNPGFTYLTLLEDDVVLAKNALDYIAMHRPDPDLVLTSWFSLAACTVPRTQPVIVCRDALYFDCNQAVTMPAATVHALLDSLVLKNWGEKHGADRIFGKVFPGRQTAIHYPNLVQHVGGAESLVGNDDQGARTSPTFVGEDFDVLGLIR